MPQHLERFQTLVDIITKLRAPDGCPWDRKQTHSSLRQHVLEECYEVLAALDEGDNEKLCGELGDLMLQIVLQAQIASEAGVAARLANGTRVAIATPHAASGGAERVADVPIHFADPLARRARSLQQTADAKPPRARMNALSLAQHSVADGAQVKIRQGRGEAILTAVADPGVPAGVVRIAAAHPSTCGLEGLSGPVTVERA